MFILSDLEKMQLVRKRKKMQKKNKQLKNMIQQLGIMKVPKNLRSQGNGLQVNYKSFSFMV